MALVPADLSRLKEGARRFASGFSRGQKTVTVLALVGVVIVAALFMSLSGRPTYSILFTNLKASDAASITQLLATNHVPYQLQDGGSTILVPQNAVDQERLAAAAAGLPAQGSVGLSLLDKEGLTTSQLTQQADYLQALQGELEQTIDAISGVQGSQVSIALPANQTFALGGTTPTGASVLVDLAPGHSLTYGQVQAITSLVGSAVPGLSAAEVTVADSNGNLLAGPGVNDNGAAQSNAATAYDANLSAKVAAYLASVLGPNNADVQVNAQLSFDQVKTTTQSLLTGPGGKVQSVCTSTNRSNERYTGNGAPPAVTGTTLATGAGGAGTGSYTQSSTQQTCEAGTRTKSVVQAPGTVVRQSVAVLVNARALPKGVSLAQLRQGSAAAAGIQPARGDVLSFASAPFAPPARALAPAEKPSLLATDLRPGIALLLVLLLVFLAWRASRRARKSAAASDAALERVLLEQLASLPYAEEKTGEIPAVSTPLVATRGSTVQDIVDRQSDEVAAVLREWLHQ